VKASRLARAAARLQKHAGGPLDAAIVLGSGLSEGVRGRIDALVEVPYKKLYAPVTTVAGHPGVAYAGTWAGKRVAAFAGRAHLYEGHAAADVVFFVRLAVASGAKTIVLTNAAGGLNTAVARGDVMLIADHINLTGATPLEPAGGNPFISMQGAYAPRLRQLARDGMAAGSVALHEGVYAGVRGPQYETPAECEAMRRLGADAVGMSTVLETIAARALGVEVLGLSLISNAIEPGADVSHGDVLAASQDGAERVATIIEGVLAAL
jgi:purine-nucleoside phosphorylase